MSTQPQTPEALESIASDQLESVAGGASRVSGKGGDADITAQLAALGSSIKDLAASKNTNSGGGDTMQLMMMMMMLMMGGGGGGGGGGGLVAPAAPVINVEASGGGGCFRRPRGKKGW